MRILINSYCQQVHYTSTLEKFKLFVQSNEKFVVLENFLYDNSIIFSEDEINSIMKEARKGSEMFFFQNDSSRDENRRLSVQIDLEQKNSMTSIIKKFRSIYISLLALIEGSERKLTLSECGIIMSLKNGLRQVYHYDFKQIAKLYSYFVIVALMDNTTLDYIDEGN